MQQLEVIKILKKDLNFDDLSMRLKKFSELVLKENQLHNLISKVRENYLV